MNWLDRFRHKLDPLVSPKEQAIRAIYHIVEPWRVTERDEILEAVIKKSFPHKRHIHDNPVKKLKEVQEGNACSI